MIRLAALALTAAGAAAQPLAAPPAPASTAIDSVSTLRAGTEVSLRTVADLGSGMNREGDRFDLVVTEDVRVGPYIVIAKGSRGIGEVTRLVPKGAFGKSGRLEVRLLYVEAGSTRIRLDGRADAQGHKQTGTAIMTVVAIGAVWPLVTGPSARIAAGSAMRGYIERDMPIIPAPER